MNETLVLSNPSAATASAGGGRPPLVYLAGIGLVSFAALLLELSLTRLFSVILFYHFAFLAISIALLGLGAGGVFAYLRRDWLARHETRALGGRLCLANAITTVAILEIVLHVPVSLNLSAANFLGLSILYLASACPFFFTGLLLSVVFAREVGRVPVLYGADLGGGALACLAVVPLLDFLGGPNTVLFASLAMAIASAVWSLPGRDRWRGLIAVAAIALVIAANASGNFIDVIYAKGVRLDRVVKVEFARWNAISRVEVDAKPDGSKWIVIDADANSALVNVDPRAWQGTWQRDLMSGVPSVANVLQPHGAFAIIGPGGGVDVLRAVATGSPSVTGIEINPIIADTIMRDRYAAYTYHLYQLPQVHLHVSDGRSFIRNSRDRYSVVQMTLVDTWASTAAGAFALSENNLYTVEAFREYFEHLDPGGFIAITRWEFKQPREALRVLAVAMEALHRLGVEQPAANFMVISDGLLSEDGRPVLVLAKRTPFTAEEEAAVRAHLARNPNLRPLYLPSDSGEPARNAFRALIASNDPDSFARSYAYNVAPVSDNVPFFFFTLKPGQLFRQALSGRGMDWKVNVGVAVLGMVLVISLVAVAAFLIVPLALGAGRRGSRPTRLIYFIALGLGYMLVEIAFIQRFVLFLGHPTYALTVVVFLLMLSSGMGSLTSSRWFRHASRAWLPLAIVTAALVANVRLLPPFLASHVGLPFVVKLLVSAAILTPLGFLMGMPFPTGLRALEQPASCGAASGSNEVEWAWAMNAASSVLGSVLAMVIAINFGLNVTLACGGTAYLLALAASGTLRSKAAV